VSTRDLALAIRGALKWVPSDMLTDEILGELDEWSEIGFALLACGCLWLLDDVDSLDDHDHG
jgi:hypothetical protein